MTAESTQTAPRSRRALLAGAIGGLGVWAASAIGRAAPAEAAAGDPIRMGRLNRARRDIDHTPDEHESTSASGRPAWCRQRDPRRGGQRPSRHGGGRQLGHRRPGRWHQPLWCPCRRREWGRGVRQCRGVGPGCCWIQRERTRAPGRGQVGLLASGWDRAADFEAPTLFWIWQDLKQMSDPPAPTNDNVRVFARQNISGKQQLCVRFETGAAQIIATEP